MVVTNKIPRPAIINNVNLQKFWYRKNNFEVTTGCQCVETTEIDSCVPIDESRVGNRKS